MKRSRWPRIWFSIMLVSALGLTAGCGGDMLRQSVKNGLLSFVAGSVSNSFDASLFGDFITSVFTGGIGGNRR